MEDELILQMIGDVKKNQYTRIVTNYHSKLNYWNALYALMDL